MDTPSLNIQKIETGNHSNCRIQLCATQPKVAYHDGFVCRPKLNKTTQMLDAGTSFEAEKGVVAPLEEVKKRVFCRNATRRSGI